MMFRELAKDENIEEGLIINKYGAVEVKQIIVLQRRIRRLEVLIEGMAGVKECSRNESLSKRIDYIHECTNKVHKLPNDFQKMKELTKCDDYEYQTTPKVTKLVKKIHKDENE